MKSQKALVATFDSPAGDIDYAIGQARGAVMGKIPFGSLFADSSVHQIFVDSFRDIRVRRSGELLDTPFSFFTAELFQLFLRETLGLHEKNFHQDEPFAEVVYSEEPVVLLRATHGSFHDGREAKLSLQIARPQQTSFFELLQLKILPATVAAWVAEVVSSSEVNMLVVRAWGEWKNSARHSASPGHGNSGTHSVS